MQVAVEDMAGVQNPVGLFDPMGLATSGNDVRAPPLGYGSVFWRSWARVIRGRLPVIGRLNADILHHGPPPAYAVRL